MYHFLIGALPRYLLHRYVVGALTIVLLSFFTSAVLAQVTVEFWQQWQQGAEEMFAMLMEEFEAQNPGIEVDLQLGGVGDQLLVRIMSGIPPALVVACAPMNEMALEGLLTPLDDLLAQSTVIREEDYLPGMFDMFRVDGVTYSIPEIGPMTGLATNVSMFDLVGIPPSWITTLNDIKEVHNKLTEVDASGVN